MVLYVSIIVVVVCIAWWGGNIAQMVTPPSVGGIPSKNYKYIMQWH
jgi:hypothetical protein